MNSCKQASKLPSKKATNLSIKQHADAVVKTLATAGAIVLSTLLEAWLFGAAIGPTVAAGSAVVIISICSYTFDATPAAPAPGTSKELKV